MKNVFSISVEDIQCLAQNEIGRELTIDEINRVQKEINSALECWGDIIVGIIIEVASSNK